MTDASRGVTVRNPRLLIHKYMSQELATQALLCRQFLAPFLFSPLPWVHSLDARYPTTTLFYQGEFGTHYQSHQLNIGLAWQF
jgi:hypothetical protein